jgi:TonB-dependent starch-binding outer membrane protein SusC
MKFKFTKNRQFSFRFVLALLLMSCFTVAFSQGTKTISGIVRDVDGSPMFGVVATLKGTTIATITNDTGAFTLNIPKDEKKPTLVLSLIGYEKKEIIVGNASVVDVIMTESANLLNEAVVVGYGTVQKKDLTGSVAKLDMKDVNLAPIRTFDEALAGRIAGVQVVSEDGQPGGESNIVIRGTGTLSQDSGPLFVIDGFPQESSNFNNINPQDIESIEVLKDASSTAIYGARGANGVIIVTTKKGKSAKPTINYNSFFGEQSPLRLLEVMNAYDFVRLQNDINPAYAARTYFQDGKTLETYRNAPSIDWQRLVIRPSDFQNHSLSLSGKSGKTTYLLSGNYVDQKGLVIKTGFKRYQARLNLDQEVTNKLRIGVALNYAATNSYGTVASQHVQGVSTSNNASASYALMYPLWSFRPVTGGDDLDSLINSVSDDASATLD